MQTNQLPSTVITSAVTTNTPSPSVTTPEITTVLTTVLPTSTQTTQTTLSNRVYVPTANDPLVSGFGYKTVSGYLIDDCIMKQAFPQYASDPNYGTTANPPKIDGISAFEFNKFIREFYEGSGQTSKQIGFSCRDTPGTQKWNFIEISADITPRNARPSDYETVVVVKKFGKTIAELKSIQTLTLEQKVSFYTYIPLRQTEVSDISGAELQFYRLTNN